MFERWPEDLPELAQRHVDNSSRSRFSTRVEIYRRLYRARDYIDSCSDRKLLLKDMAAIAGLSPHHFLRLFKQAFQATPRQYLIHRRLARAQELLRNTDLEVSQICFEVGFESASSFSTLFRRRLGASPLQFRQTVRR